jgi:uncharacterized membrane protein
MVDQWLEDEIREYERGSDERLRQAHELHEGEKVECSITIDRPVHHVFAYWRDFTNLPRFMTHLKSIEILSPSRTHWSWRGLGGVTLEWDAEIITEMHDRMISWQTLPDSAIQHAGSVWFRPIAPNGATEVHVYLLYRVPGGRLTQKVAKLLAELFGNEPARNLRSDLERLKNILEASNTRGVIH